MKQNKITKSAKPRGLDLSLGLSALAYLCVAGGTAWAEETLEPARKSGKAASGQAKSASKAKARRPAPPPPAEAVAGDAFSAYDWNGDGIITREEWARGPRPGSVSPAQAPAPQAGAAEAAPADANAEDFKAEEQAAELAESNPKQLGEVTVTANKRKESAQKVPSAITVLSGRRMADQNIGRSAGEVLNYVPNASAGTQFHGRPRWWIRGVGTGQQQLDLTNPVGFYQDQVYMSNSTSTGFPLFDLERVEILRGPQGTLWGKNTTGGAIDVESRKPTLTGSQEGYAKLVYGTYNNYIAEGGYGTKLNEWIAARAAFHYDHQDGRFNTLDPATRTFTGQSQGGWDDAMFRLSFLAKPTKDLEALFNVHYRTYDNQGTVQTLNTDAVNPVTGVVYKDPLTGFTNRPSLDPNVISSSRRLVVTENKVNQKGALLNLTQKFDRYALTSITGYEDWSSSTYGSSAQSPQSSWQVSQEFRLASPKEDRWNWIAGLHYFYEHIDSTSTTSTLPCGVGLTTKQIAALPNGGGCLSGLAGQQAYSNSQYQHDDQSFAIFTSHTFNFTDQLLSTFGLRYTHESKDVDMLRQQARLPTGALASASTLNYNGALNAGGVAGNGAVASNPLFYDTTNWWKSVNPKYLPAPVALSPYTVNNPATANATNFLGKKNYSWDLLTYDVTPQWKINGTDMVFFKHARGAKSGGFNTGASTLSVLNSVIKPETIMSYELGAKTGWFDNRLKANATLFYYDYQNDQLNITAVPNPAVPSSPTGYIYNVNAAHSQGAEFEVEALPWQDLHLTGNIGLLDTSFDDVSNINQTGVPQLNKILAGNEMVRAPHFTSFLQADYRVPYQFPGNTHLVLSGDWRYTSPQYFYVNFQTSDTPYRGLYQGGYSLLNFRATLASNDEKYSLTGYVNNALNTTYLNHSLTPTPGSLNAGYQMYGQPLTLGLQLNARFF